MEQYLRFAREEKRPTTAAEVRRHRALVAGASGLYDQVQQSNGALDVRADPAALSAMVQGCVMAAGDEVKDACELADTAQRCAAVRRAIVDLEMWVDMLEAVEEGAG